MNYGHLRCMLQGFPGRSRRIEEQDWNEISIGMRCANDYLNVSQGDVFV